MEMLWEASKKLIQPDLQILWQNDIEIDIISDLPFTFYVQCLRPRNVTDLTVLASS